MSKASRLAELRALRASGKSRLSTYQVQEEEKLYEEVDEEGYKKIVRNRLDRDDFVIDDNGQGYADDGREEWMGGSASESEPELPLKGKAAKRKREEDKDRTEKTNNSINRYFQNGPAVVAPKSKPITTVEDAAFMADILGQVDTNVAAARGPPFVKAVKSESRRKTRILSPPVSEKKRTQLERQRESKDTSQLNTPPLVESDYDDGDDGFLGGVENDDVPVSDPAPSSPLIKALERKVQGPVKVEEEDDDTMEVSQALGNHNVKSVSVNISGSRPAPKIIKKPPYPSPGNSSPTLAPSVAVDPSAWNDVTSKLNVLSSPPIETAGYGKLKAQDALEEDGSLRMFWTDYTEVNGSLCLFGKVKNKKLGTYVSTFIKVDNILRKLFFLPRTYKQRNGRDTSDEVEMPDLYQEVDGLMTRLRVGMHKIKSSSRKYAFELPDIPKEADYLKLMYPYEKPALPMDLKGETFSHVFGTNTALFEQFALWKNIMGPCWLKIEDEEFTSLNNASWCKLELQVSNPKAIIPLKDSDLVDSPPMTFMSLALRTRLNIKENKQEILAVSARVYENISLSDTTPPEKLPSKTFTVMRPIELSFPVGFDAATKKQRGAIYLEKNEQMLLSKFLALLEKMDPDVLMGHQLQDVDYPIILNRMRERKTPGWHRIGRLRRSDWPKMMGKAGGSFFAERQLVSGRLLCDVANDMGKSLMTKCQSWSLKEMCELYIGDNVSRREFDNEDALRTWATSMDGLMNYLNHCEADTYFIAAIALKVQMLPLTKVLTNLAGNSWARTLSGTRAERNEYILLHEFHRNKYICPDKIFGKGKQKVEQESPEGEEGVDVKKKDKYKGGLVFEPEKGLYDKFILVMDFNSLYPSIIQEYNICFTTVDRSDQSEEEEKVPEVPTDQNQGILPKLIATLVSRRREVKKLMKDKRATPEQLATWDIKQLALKLTANSMYGCLGYTQSRFYARPLAMLTTYKGREILRSTKDLAESTQLRVIYGDTDSVMINTNADTIEEALKMGREFKTAVNDRYKLLEIDIDNVFRRLLLHAKKKYAAINLVEIDGKYTDKLEVKGLDMKRREYCALSKEASSRLLNEILSGEDPEVVVGKIHQYLRDLSQQMKEEKIPSQKYIIYTKLGKDPRSYPSPDSMPQVQVALRALAAGKSVRANDVISYITTAPLPDTPFSFNAAKRAFAPLDILNPASSLKPDIEWYLAKQLFPPIERLCAPIAGTDPGQLAECLGLDPNKYAASATHASGGSGSTTAQDFAPLESLLPLSLRYKDCPRLHLRCTKCAHTFPFEGLSASTTTADLLTPQGIVCPASGCSTPFRTLTLVAQVESAVRVLTSRYYDAWVVCDDPSCGNRTRMLSVYGHRCLGPQGRAKDCRGRMRWEEGCGGKEVGRTLGFWRGVWDVDFEFETVGGKGRDEGERERLRALREWNRERFGTVRGVVEAYLRSCGWVWVQMDSLFGFALR